MKAALVLISILALSGVALFFSGNESNNLQAAKSGDAHKTYQAWKAQYNKNSNGQEDKYRFQVFVENLTFLTKHNNNTDKLSLGLTEFADLTNEEFRALMTSEITVAPKGSYASIEKKAMNTVNWVTKGAVTDVKNQGVCGSCWAFSATAGLEGLNAVNGGNLSSFSDQQVTSCTPAPFSLGCNGGNPLFAYLYTAARGVTSNASYPYVQESNPKTAACAIPSDSKVVFKNAGVGQVEPNSPEMMGSAIQNQPLSVAVDAGSIFFQLYNGGILNSENCGSSLNHAITLVGYNSSENYWTVKNSWGTGWGSKGYANIANATGNGICGINMDVSYPTM